MGRETQVIVGTEIQDRLTTHFYFGALGTGNRADAGGYRRVLRAGENRLAAMNRRRPRSKPGQVRG